MFRLRERNPERTADRPRREGRPAALGGQGGVPLSTAWIHGSELAATEKNGRSRQAAMSPDPISDQPGIGGGHHTRRLRRRIFAAVLVDGPCGVKAEHRSPRDADAAARNNNENERAGGKAGAVDDDALAGLPQLLEKLDKRAGLASRAGFDPHLG